MLQRYSLKMLQLYLYGEEIRLQTWEVKTTLTSAIAEGVSSNPVGAVCDTFLLLL